MEELLNSYESLVPLLLSGSGGNATDVSFKAGLNPNHYLVASDGWGNNDPKSLPLPHWFHCSLLPQSQFPCPTESSSYSQSSSSVNGFETMFTSASDANFAEGVSQIRGVYYSCSNYELDFGCDLAYTSPDLDAWRWEQPLYMLNPENNDPHLDARLLEAYNNGELVKKPELSHHWNCSQDHASHNEEPNADIGKSSKVHPRVTIAPSVFVSNPSHSTSKRKGSTNAIQRKEEIAKRIQALQGLLPNSTNGSQEAVIQDVIDHIKDLQSQMKEAVDNLLGDELASFPVIFIKGQGHYLYDGHITYGPLEDMVEKLLEEDPFSVTRLLASKGLVLMPVAFADKL